MSVSKRFDTFLSNLRLTEPQKASGASLKESVVKALNYEYYGWTSGTSNSQYVGSWAKRTRIRPPRDVDVTFVLPQSVRTKYDGRAGNRQSQLLQEVRSVLLRSFPSTAIRGDGPVVLVPFSAFNVELIPCFASVSGGYDVCFTNNGGRYKRADYGAESGSITSSNSATDGNTRDLIRMMKRWQSYCNVPLKSFFIELIAIEFLSTWGNAGKTTVYYDWMCRDFLRFLIGKQNTFLFAPGTYELMFTGSSWVSKAESAHGRASKACEYEGNSATYLAGDEWQKIFGTDIPRSV